MKSILTFLKMDATNALRDSLIVYILIAPILLSVGLRIFVPGFEQTRPPVVLVAPEVFLDSSEYSILAGSLDLTGVLSREELDLVVLGRDHTAGMIVTENTRESSSSGGGSKNETSTWTMKLVFQGNEPQEYRDVVTLLGATALGGSAVDGIGPDGSTQTEVVQDMAGDSGPSRLFQYALVMLSMMASLIGGIAVAFVMIDEKEQNITRSFAAAPVTRGTYYGARGITAGGLGVVLALIGHGIAVGFGFRIGWYLAALGASVPMALMVALLVGGIARNQIQGIAVLKIVMALFLTLPLVSIFLGPTWQPLFYGFPNYWMFKTLEAVYVTEPAVLGPGFLLNVQFGFLIGMTLVLGSLGAGILIYLQGKELKPGWQG